MMKVTTKRSHDSRLCVANIIEEGKIGGPQIRIIRVAKFIEKKVKKVIIKNKENSKELQQRCQSLGVPFQAIPLSRITKELRPALRYLFFTPWEIIQLIRFFRQEKFDVIHVSGGIWQFKGAIAGRLAGISVLWHLNDTDRQLLFRWIFGILSCLDTGYAYAAERTKIYYQPYVHNKRLEFMIPAPVDTNWFDPNLDLPPDQLLSKLDGKFVIGTLANPSPVKDVESFLKMAAKLQELTSLPLDFVVVGRVYEAQQNYFNFLEKISKQLRVSVQWAGPRVDVRSLLKRFDIYLCSSRSESSPISVWEAMSMANPIVSTDVGDVSLYVHDEENGFVVPVGDVDRLTNRVLRLLNDETMCRRFGNNSRKIAQQNLDISFCGERHLNAYKQIYSCF